MNIIVLWLLVVNLNVRVDSGFMSGVVLGVLLGVGR